MGNFRVLIRRSAADELELLPLASRELVVAVLKALAEDPLGELGERVDGGGLRRVSIGASDERLVYSVDLSRRSVTVVTVGKRVGVGGIGAARVAPLAADRGAQADQNQQGEFSGGEW